MLNKKEEEEEEMTKEEFIQENITKVTNPEGTKIAEAVVLVSENPIMEVLKGIIEKEGICIGRIGDILDKVEIEDIEEKIYGYTPEYMTSPEEICKCKTDYDKIFAELKTPLGKHEVLRGLMLIIEEIWDENKDYEVDISDEMGTNIFGYPVKTGRKIMTLKYVE